MNPKLRLYLALEYFGFIGIATYLYVNHLEQIAIRDFIFLMVVLLITRNISMFFNSIEGIITSIVLPVIFPAFVILGPFWTAVITGLGTIEFKYRENKFIWYKFLFNRFMLFMSGGIGALVYQISSRYYQSPYHVFSLFLASLAYFIVNNSLVYIVVRLAGDEATDSSLSLYFMQLCKSLITSYFIGLIFYYSFVNFGKVFFALLIILLYVFKDFLYSRIQQLNAYTQVIESFLKVIDSKDQYTEGHCERVANYTYYLCQELGLSKGRTQRIVNMAKIHDIGKIYVDDSVLKSSKKLSAREFELMKKHSYYGYEILKDIDLMKEDLDIILYHHERYDGQGYPEGIEGEAIPLGSRILSVCDAFDVMTTGRSYKPALTRYEIIAELKECAGGQFDPRVARAMVNLINKGYFDDNFLAENENDLRVSFNT